MFLSIFFLMLKVSQWLLCLMDRASVITPLLFLYDQIPQVYLVHFLGWALFSRNPGSLYWEMLFIDHSLDDHCYWVCHFFQDLSGVQSLEIYREIILLLQIQIRNSWIVNSFILCLYLFFMLKILTNLHDFLFKCSFCDLYLCTYTHICVYKINIIFCSISYIWDRFL